MDFISETKKTFNFLEKDFGFHVEKIRNHSTWQSLTYCNNYVGVDIGIDNRDHIILIKIYKLINGKIVKYSPESKQDFSPSYGLEDIISIKIHDPKFEYNFNQSPETTLSSEKQIKILSKDLKKFCRDIFKRNFETLSEIEKIKSKRNKI